MQNDSLKHDVLERPDTRSAFLRKLGVGGATIVGGGVLLGGSAGFARAGDPNDGVSASTSSTTP